MNVVPIYKSYAWELESWRENYRDKCSCNSSKSSSSSHSKDYTGFVVVATNHLCSELAIFYHLQIQNATGWEQGKTIKLNLAKDKFVQMFVSHRSAVISTTNKIKWKKRNKHKRLIWKRKKSKLYSFIGVREQSEPESVAISTRLLMPGISSNSLSKTSNSMKLIWWT